MNYGHLDIVELFYKVISDLVISLNFYYLIR